MKKALTLRVEMYHKGNDQPPTVGCWYILPEHVQGNVKSAANRNEILVKTYVTTEGDPVAGRKPYFDFDGAAVAAMLANPDDRQSFIDYEGVRHFEDNRDTIS